MRRGWLWAALALGLVCALFAVESLQLALFDSLGPGPGFFPLCLGAAGVVLAAALAWQVHSGRAELESEALEFDRRGLRTLVYTLIVLALATALLEVFGFGPVMLVALAALLWLHGVRHWPVIAGFALAGSFGVYHLFSVWLKVPLPPGTLFD